MGTRLKLDEVIHSFHPWYYHEISLENQPPPKEDHYRALFLSKDSGLKWKEEFHAILRVLPEPKSLDEILASLRSNLLAHPKAMLGEVGLDRSFRIAYQPYPSPPPRKLSPFSTPIDHQLAILEAQIDLAVELKRNISMHSVTAQQITLDLLQQMKEKHGSAWRAISVDIHSCGLSLEGWKTLEVPPSLIHCILHSNKVPYRETTTTSSCLCLRRSTQDQTTMYNSFRIARRIDFSQSLTTQKWGVVPFRHGAS